MTDATLIKPQVHVSASGEAHGAAIMAQLRKLGHINIDVGVHRGAGQYPDGTDIAVVAAAMEFGTETIPARSFIRSTVDDKRDALNHLRQELVHDVTEGHKTAEKAAEVLGFRVKSYIESKIASNVGPQLSPRYARWKVRQGKPARTLILTGLLWRSISYKVSRQA